MIELRAEQDDSPEPEEDRAVRIAFGVDVRVMAAVHGHPLLRRHRRAQPEPQPHQMFDDRMKPDAAMRLRAMEIQRHARGRDVCVDQGEKDVDVERAVRPHGVVVEKSHFTPKARIASNCLNEIRSHLDIRGYPDNDHKVHVKTLISWVRSREILLF